jgi:hypothetical protein
MDKVVPPELVCYIADLCIWEECYAPQGLYPTAYAQYHAYYVRYHAYFARTNRDILNPPLYLNSNLN